jgi:flagellar protein FlgJ
VNEQGGTLSPVVLAAMQAVAQNRALGAISVYPNQRAFVEARLSDALAAWNEFQIHPIISIAQAALESGWGSSTLARDNNNYFGLSAGMASRWHNGQSPVRWTGWINARVYPNPRSSWLDYSNLVAKAGIYTNVYAQRKSPAKWAKAIANSPYIAESNGDNRALYERTQLNYQAIVAEVMKDAMAGGSVWPWVLGLSLASAAGLGGYYLYARYA